MDFIEFKALHSEIIMFSQIIEHDIKLIYSYMKKGDRQKNLEQISKRSLGQTINILKELDYNDGVQTIPASVYNYLQQMTKKRNYWAHENYQEFLYLEHFDISAQYKAQCKKIKNDHKKLYGVYSKLEKIRMKYTKNF